MAKHGAVLTTCECPRRRLFWLIPVVGAACLAAAYNLMPSSGSRGPRVVPDCVPPSIDEFPWDGFNHEQRQNGWVVLHILLTGYICASLATVCDSYFVPSLEVICERFQVPTDVAGATFMAIGTSSPELFSALIGSFVTEGDIGIGTIVGSAVFNILGVTSLTGLMLWKSSVPLDWFPISRDSLVYLTSVGALVLIIRDNIVTRLEASVLLAMFLIYIAMMVYNKKIEKFAKKKMRQVKKLLQKSEDACCTYCRDKTRRSQRKKNNNNNEEELPEKMKAERTEKKALFQNLIMQSAAASDIISTASDDSTSHDGDSDSDDGSEAGEDDTEGSSVLRVIMWPAETIFRLTIPDCKKDESLYPYTFVFSVIWIGIFSYLCSWMVTIIGHTFGLPDSVAGLTILAAGISVPEIVANIIVVKNGKANMALSNLIGSNIFDILFCLGVPWLVKTSMSAVGELVIYSAALTYTSLTLLTTVLLLYLTLCLSGWRLNSRVGGICLAFYMVFLVVACMCELNMFGQLNPPTCA